MINLLVQSAFQTGCVSVASEALLRQLLKQHIIQPSDLTALDALDRAVTTGRIRREGLGDWLAIASNMTLAVI
ncbi:hypothetical protein [Spirulina sp. 06S082]|uniref:hypothetical protein n=1 Tax=Spirulina sp. 06S082 TaxID=3110248 RepID=UPI002B20425E|nr:hypothetical protein [Spirulina sp. 06S082]MEA5470509.1 hypothetical protein [Spirulina sp. 06S082]